MIKNREENVTKTILNTLKCESNSLTEDFVETALHKNKSAQISIK